MYREIVSRVSDRCLIDSLRDGRREGERGPVFHFIQWSGKIQIASFVPGLEVPGRCLGGVSAILVGMIFRFFGIPDFPKMP